ncbi:MAG: tetratricopeptide repeat protein, partial [Candidatus Obscuribacterales bacterium]|nr:tetratricopeptide repeat protein [Candidatus Obscuribacterales bacterium]
ERNDSGLKAKILDFGLAKIAEAESDSARLTATGDALGTPAYMSPEQCDGRELDRRTDIYSLACVFYEVLTGKLAFSGSSPLEIMFNHNSAKITPLKEAKPELQSADELESVLMHALEPDPAMRYGSAQELAEDLRKIQQGIPLRKHKSTRRLKLEARRNILIVLSVVLLLTLALLFRQFLQPGQNLTALSASTRALSPNTVRRQIANPLPAASPSRVDIWKGHTLSQYNAMIDKDPNNARLLYNRGTLYKLREERPNAIADFSRAIELKNDFIEAYVERAEQYGRLFEFEKALKDLDKAIALDPRWDWTYMRKAQVESAAELYDDAIEDCQKAIALNPKRAVPQTELARIYDQLGEHEKAVELVNKAMTLRGASLAEFSARALFEMRMKQYAKALKDLKFASREDWAEPFAYEALVYARLNKMEEALVASDKAFALDPFPARSYRLRAELFSAASDFENAIENYSLAISLEPSYAPAYRSRALAYLKMHQLNNALNDLKKAVQLNPFSATSLSLLARVEGALAKTVDAERHMKEAFSRGSLSAVCYLNRAHFYIKKGDLSKARADCRKCLEIDPHLNEASELLNKLSSRESE